jgi:hypothetical protein
MKRFKVQQVYLAFIMLILSGFLITGCGSGGGEVTEHWAPGMTLVSIAVTPATASIPISGTQQYTATATYSNGSTIDRTTASTWTSGTAGVATISPSSGFATGIATGTSLITATFEGMTATATLTVNTAISTKFEVTPATASIPATVIQQYTATETFSDGSTFDRTAVSTWSAADVAPAVGVATIVATTGLATGKVAGKSTITATYAASPFSPATAILTVTTATSEKFEVAPATASIPVSGTQQFAAIETFSDGTTSDRTTASAWSTSGVSAANATVGAATGLATGVTATPAGVPVVITATYGVYTGTTAPTATLTVTAATSESFKVTPATASIVVDSTQQYTAIETFSDGTTFDRTTESTCHWTAVDLSGSGVATISNTSPNIGQATGKAAGTSTITAAYGVYTGTAAATATLTVTDVYPASCAGPGPLDLGTAANFGVLAGTALDLTNPTSVTGDVGSPSITPAAGPSTLVGTMYDTSTGSLVLIAKAVTDMETAIGCAKDRTCDFNYAATKDFGGATLSPGVHCVTGAMSVGSNLTLSTPGVYIFRSTGALTTDNTITVALGGTATATNTSIFWVPTTTTAGSNSIGATTTFLGTIMPDQSTAITLGANTTLKGGRTLSGAAVTLDKNTIAKPSY